MVVGGAYKRDEILPWVLAEDADSLEAGERGGGKVRVPRGPRCVQRGQRDGEVEVVVQQGGGVIVSWEGVREGGAVVEVCGVLSEG